MSMPSRKELAGMTGGERLFATGMDESFNAAIARRDLKGMREILQALDFDELSIARTLRDADAAWHPPTAGKA